MLRESDIAYLAGLFDGEGCVYMSYRKKGKSPKKYLTITMEMAMTEESIIRWVHEILGVGTIKVLDKANLAGGKPHWKKQWRWRCTHRDAYYVARLLWPFAHVKLEKIQKIIDHYAPIKAANVVSLEDWKGFKNRSDKMEQKI